MILKKLISVMSVFAIIVSSFTTAVVSADEEMTPIACTQSASYLTDGDGNVGIPNQILGAEWAFLNLPFLRQKRNA